MSVSEFPTPVTKQATATDDLPASSDRRRVSAQNGAPSGETRHRQRGDIEGLRAIAVALVVLYHAGVPFLPGGYVGVDIFLVISGFLITSQLVSELERTGSVSLTRFYARRAKRLLPAVATVLIVSAALTRFFIPKTQWEAVGGDIVGSALYVVNWRFAARSVDYLAEGTAPSPVQHFWSLAVEEQYYVVWPLLIILAALVARMLRRRAKPLVWTLLLLVAVPSVVYSVIATAHSPESAFFVTPTRVWELAIGAGLALSVSQCARLPRVWAIVLGWAGVVCIAASALVFSSETAWPGYNAALPTLGTAAVIAAGCSTLRRGPELVLGTAPFRWVGGLSYSLYLWHWPLLVAATAHWDGTLTVGHGLLVALVSVIPAWLTHRLIENPLRYSAAVSGSPRLALSLGANFTFVGVVAGMAILLGVTSSTAAAGGPARQAPGAAVLAADPRDDPAGAPPDHVEYMVPDPLQATKDLPDAYADGCHQNADDAKVLSCTYGDPNSKIRVAAAGDSKIAQWLPALQLLATQNNWRLTIFTKSGCTLTSAKTMKTDGTKQPYTSCAEWNSRLLPYLINTEKPDYVITSQVSSSAIDTDGRTTPGAMVAGLRKSWSALTRAGMRVIVLADNPDPGMEVYECVAKNPDRLSACAFDRDKAWSAAPIQKRAAAGMAHVSVVDLHDAICPTARCSPVIGNVLVYRQGSHLTATYVKTLTPRLAKALPKAGLRAKFDAAAVSGPTS
ncbi:SGNH hydrolase domain-containing protein [Planotetraspora phitsanulokensis]|uniref:Acyltransferase n=1 Tax=Planotetraspora phitsanulokensis TaxID=575192 RepID=A0A8J3U5P2_9ACTN|nr:acyltransferase family protein [Planotetraspora phitsanulokensis]GII38651.1 acyltransferase [Planotetraspora phitsanulokensis]